MGRKNYGKIAAKIGTRYPGNLPVYWIKVHQIVQCVAESEPCNSLKVMIGESVVKRQSKERRWSILTHANGPKN